MGQALYRKYRPHTLKDVAGQEHITKTLQKAIDSDRISHAYLFTGPRGVGKTSVARILAYQVNGLKYDEDANHMDVIEIDGASNGRVEEIRDLRERAYVSPTEAKYKVYIIDEVHMVTPQGFNALLKTLEEPPMHVIFILATTEAHKLPATIISRTQRFSFKPITEDDIVKRLSMVATKEKISIDDASLALIAEHSDGSLRDSLSILDHIRNLNQDINADLVRQTLGIAPTSAIDSFLSANLSISELTSNLNNLYLQGYQPELIAKQLGQIVRSRIINNQSDDQDKELDLLTSLLEVPRSRQPDKFLEIILIKFLPHNKKTNVDTIAEVEADVKVTVVEQPEIKTETIKPATIKSDSKSKLSFDENLWSEVLSALKQKHNTLYGVVRMASPEYKKGELNLKFAFEFHKKRISEATNKKILADIINDLTGESMTIKCFIDKNVQPFKLSTVSPPHEPKSDEVSTISSIFNGAELLES